MRRLLKLGLAAVVAMMVLASCGTVDAAMVADAVVQTLRPALEQIDGLSQVQQDAIAKAVSDSITGGLSANEFNWEGPLWGAIGAVTSYFGVNIRRDQKRAVRGEKV